MPLINHSSLGPDSNDSERILLERIAAAHMAGLGEHGADYIGDTTLRTGNWCAIQAIETSELIDYVGTVNYLDFVPLTAGTIIYGHHTTLGLDSGKIIAYRSAS